MCQDDDQQDFMTLKYIFLFLNLYLRKTMQIGLFESKLYENMVIHFLKILFHFIYLWLHWVFVAEYGLSLSRG